MGSCWLCVSMTQASVPEPHRALNKLNDAMTWALGTLDAIGRLEATFGSAFHWGDGLPGTPRGRRSRMMSQYLEFNVVWAANHLVTAYSRLRKETRERIPDALGDMIKIVEALRDVLEHWEKNWGRDQTGAHHRLRGADPGAVAWTTQFDQVNGITLAGSLRVRSLGGWASGVFEVCEAEFVSIAEEFFA